MRLAPRPGRETPEGIVPLIDVVLFLLIFFMLIGRMDATAPFAVTPPEAAAGSDMPGGGSTVAIGGQGELALDGSAVPREALLAGIREALARDPARLVRLNADRDARLRDVLPLATEIRALGAREVVLVITPDAP